MSENFYQRMFLTGALWNLLGGIVLVAITGKIFSSAKLPPPQPPVFYYAWIALFMTFGIGYWMVSADPYGNRNIVILGIIGKLAFSVIFVTYMVLFSGQVPLLFLIPIVGDLIFVVLFWMFLRFAANRRS
jgi:hypothetical protein